MARSLLEVSLVFALLSGCDRPAASPRPPAHLDTNVVLVTACGLRCDLLEEACRSGATPALARLRADASSASTVTTPSSDCLAAHASLFLGARAAGLGIVGPASDVLPARGSSWVAVAAARGARTAAFLSRMLVDRGDVDGESDFGFAALDLPPLERFGVKTFGSDAAALSPRRDDAATLAAALAWLHHAATPFVLWIELDALALETGAPAERLREAAGLRLATLDRAVAEIRAELARAGRDRRTTLVLAADHGEALGEDGSFGHRAPLACVACVPLWIVDPDAPDAWRGGAIASLADFAPRLLARWSGVPPAAASSAGASGATAGAWAGSTDHEFAYAGPLGLDYERGAPPLTEEEARARLPRIRTDLAAHPAALPIAEHYVAALAALEAPSDDEERERRDAQTRWLEPLVAGMPRRPLAAVLLARAGSELDVSPARREAAARAAVRAAPWYFPAVRALAVLQQQSLQPQRALATLERFGATAPLSPAARVEFEKQIERTRKNLGR
ncbi:MAG TPA: hypothetical protein VFG37_12530 [Planctomycetota bacterium]|nr:hypothetical protein [Planctomycetota bacterium]